LIVIDPLSRFAGPDAEKDNAAATRFVQCLEALAKAGGPKPGATVIVAHHTNKVSRDGKANLSSTASRGSSAFTDGARFQCGLGVEELDVATEHVRQLGEVVTLSVTKSNYAEKPLPITLRRDRKHGGVLLPLDEDERAFVRDARSRAKNRAAKAEQEARERIAKVVAEVEKHSDGIASGALRALVRGKGKAIDDAAEAAEAAGLIEIREVGNRRLHFPVKGLGGELVPVPGPIGKKDKDKTQSSSLSSSNGTQRDKTGQEHSAAKNKANGVSHARDKREEERSPRRAGRGAR
jgi:hypothetical protein